MNTAKLIAALDDELSRLRQVRALLAGEAPVTPKPRRGRPPKSLSAAATTTTPVSKRKRTLSDEARQRIAEAQKRRWAAQKRTAQ